MLPWQQNFNHYFVCLDLFHLYGNFHLILSYNTRITGYLKDIYKGAIDTHLGSCLDKNKIVPGSCQCLTGPKSGSWLGSCQDPAMPLHSGSCEDL